MTTLTSYCNTHDHEDRVNALETATKVVGMYKV